MYPEQRVWTLSGYRDENKSTVTTTTNTVSVFTQLLCWSRATFRETRASQSLPPVGPQTPQGVSGRRGARSHPPERMLSDSRSGNVEDDSRDEI